MQRTLMLKEKGLLDDRGKMMEEKKMMQEFLARHAGKKNLLVIRTSAYKDEVMEELLSFSEDTKRELILLSGKEITPENIRDLTRKKDQPILIGINELSSARNLGTTEEAAVYRAIINMADTGNEEFGLHPDSSFVFLAEEEFPSHELATVSLTWAYETAFLDCRDFRSKVMDHMKSYKEKSLRVKEEVSHNGRTYSHILPEKYYEMNFSREVKEKLVGSKYLSSIHWHRYSHHLNSSQVMAVNFFYPLLRYRELDTLLGLMGMEDEIIYDPSHISFSKISEIENTQGRKTCFDFYFKLKSGKDVYVVAKYTEGCYERALDEDYLRKYEETYRPLLEQSEIIKEEHKNQKVFLENYSCMRNLVHLSRDSYLLVIYPRENWKVRSKALTAEEKILKDDFKGHYLPVVWEDLLELLIEKMKNNDVARFYESWFKDKYFRY
ncbi:PGN_0703 family putative restriction endonuclease [Proteiniclasticum sp. C24MP]|uniref:PGN_0703 family putative restriction endonuclease n=1 Tax=Proteiniclasticum sp. C24MP TaxID=3374101 RepID=UPI003754DF5B